MLSRLVLGGTPHVINVMRILPTYFVSLLGMSIGAGCNSILRLIEYGIRTKYQRKANYHHTRSTKGPSANPGPSPTPLPSSIKPLNPLPTPTTNLPQTGTYLTLPQMFVDPPPAHHAPDFQVLLLMLGVFIWQIQPIDLGLWWEAGDAVVLEDVAGEEAVVFWGGL